jgi:hypothetical protein
MPSLVVSIYSLELIRARKWRFLMESDSESNQG